MEPDPRLEAGPTSGAHLDCSLKRTLGQGYSDQNGTRALTTVIAALNQGSWEGDQGTTTAQGAGGSVAPGSGSDDSCRRWRHEQGLRALAMVRAGSVVAQSRLGSGRTAVVVATGSGDGGTGVAQGGCSTGFGKSGLGYAGLSDSWGGEEMK